MSEHQEPEFPVADWELLPLEVLKTTYHEVKQYFHSQLDETTSVTSKAIQFGLGFLSFLFGVSLLVFIKHPPTIWHYVLYSASAIDIGIAIFILLGRKGHEIGLRTSNILSSDFDDHQNFNDEEKEKLAYYNMIKSYEQKINDTVRDNQTRAKWYNGFLILTVTLLFFTSIYALIISVRL